MGRVREKRREEERRSEKRKSQKKEDADAGKGRKVAKHGVFPMICGSGGSKVRSLKRRVRSPLARGEMKNCTPLWREAQFEVKMYKTHILYEQLTQLVNVLYRFSSTSPTRQYVQHKNELGILNHVEHVLSSLTKQHGEFMNKVKSVNLFSHISAPPTLQNNTLNRRRKLAF